MKKISKVLLYLTLSLGVLGFGINSFNYHQASTAYAESRDTYPRNGTSGTILYVNGNNTYFNTNEADLAIYVMTTSGTSMWSEKVNYRVYGDYLRVMIPYSGTGQSITWSKFIVCRYNPALNPSVNGFDGVYNKTYDINFSSFMYAQNTVNITGYNEDGTLKYVFNNNSYYGIKGEEHLYLDLSHFPSWEEGNAKFAIYFAYPNTTNESRWSQAYLLDGYHSSFCWKVNGQDNDHLYECVVPNLFSHGENIWNMVIAVRFNPEASEPNWDYKWNQSQNLSFNNSNHNANMIVIDEWGHGELDNEHIISKASRLDFYGRYFLNNVTCSGDGSKDMTTEEGWNKVKYDYQNHLSRLYQGDIWTTTPSKESSLIAQAMERYDYIVLYKQYNHEDFINRKESPNHQEYGSAFLMNNNNHLSMMILIISLSTLSITSFLIIHKKKMKNK